MKRCRACRRITKGKKRAYWRPFILFSLLAHLFVTAAFSQISLNYPIQDISFIQLIELPRHYAIAGTPVKNTDRKAEKKSSGHRKNPARIATDSRINDVVLEKPLPPPHDSGLGDSAPAQAATVDLHDNIAIIRAGVIDYSGTRGQAAEPSGIVVIRGVEKEVLMAKNDPAQQLSAQDNPAPLSGYSVNSFSTEKDAPIQTYMPVSRQEGEKINLTPNNRLLVAVTEPVLAGDKSKIATPTMPIAVKMEIEPAVKITRPSGGYADDSEAEVAGLVTGEGISSVNLLVNGNLWEAPVRDGGFKAEVSLKEGVNEITAAVTDASGRKAEDSIKISYMPADIVVRFNFKCPKGCAIVHKWAPHPLGAGMNGPSPDEIQVKADVFSVRHAAPGIYTVGIKYDASDSNAEIAYEAVLSGHDVAKRKMRTYGPYRLQDKGEFVAVRILMPERIFWDENSWFSGIIRDGSTTTKYKMPEGIIWKEYE